MNEYPALASTSLDHTRQVHILEQLSDEEFWSYARSLAQKAPALPVPAEYLLYTLSKGNCLFPTEALAEVVPPPHRYSLLPAAPAWMFGVLAWRGETIAVIDLEAYLTGGVAGTTCSPAEDVLLVAEHETLPLGLLVPGIARTLPVSPEEVTRSTEAFPSWVLASRTSVVVGTYTDALVLHVPELIADVVRQIGIAASYG